MVRFGPGRAELHHGQRIAQLLSPVFELRDDVRDVTASAAASTQSPRTELKAAPSGDGSPAGERVVQSDELVDEHAERPAVADDLVHGDEQEVFLLGQAHQASPKQRALREVEGMKQLLLE